MAGVGAVARATGGHLLGRARWLVEVVRLRTRLLVLWTLHWVESRRLQHRRRALFARLGEAVYRGDGGRGAEARAELERIEQRLSEQQQRLGREIEETLRREREAELASRRTGTIRLPAQGSETVPEPAPPAAPEQPSAPEPAPGEAGPPRISESEERSSEAPTLDDVAPRSPGRRRVEGARHQAKQSKPSARRRSG